MGGKVFVIDPNKESTDDAVVVVPSAEPPIPTIKTQNTAPIGHIPSRDISIYYSTFDVPPDQHSAYESRWSNRADISYNWNGTRQTDNIARDIQAVDRVPKEQVVGVDGNELLTSIFSTNVEDRCFKDEHMETICKHYGASVDHTKRALIDSGYLVLNDNKLMITDKFNDAVKTINTYGLFEEPKTHSLTPVTYRK